MSTPRNDYTRPLAGTIMEIAGAMSALNMLPEPIPKPDPDEPGFLSHTDKWAAHAMEHLSAAVEQISRLQIKIERMETMLALLGHDYEEAPHDRSPI